MVALALWLGAGGVGSRAWATPPAAGPAPAAVQQVVGVPAGNGATAGPAPANATTAGLTPGAGPLPGAGAGAGGGGMGPEFMLILMLGLGLMIMMSFMASRKDRKRRAEMLSGLALGDRVVTSGGMIGTIVELREGEVSLRSDEGNVRLRFTRESVSRVVQRSGAGGAQGAA